MAKIGPNYFWYIRNDIELAHLKEAERKQYAQPNGFARALLGFGELLMRPVHQLASIIEGKYEEPIVLHPNLDTLRRRRIHKEKSGKGVRFSVGLFSAILTILFAVPGFIFKTLAYIFSRVLRRQSKLTQGALAEIEEQAQQQEADARLNEARREAASLRTQKGRLEEDLETLQEQNRVLEDVRDVLTERLAEEQQQRQEQIANLVVENAEEAQALRDKVLTLEIAQKGANSKKAAKQHINEVAQSIPTIVSEDVDSDLEENASLLSETDSTETEDSQVSVLSLDAFALPETKENLTASSEGQQAASPLFVPVEKQSALVPYNYAAVQEGTIAFDKKRRERQKSNSQSSGNLSPVTPPALFVPAETDGQESEVESVAEEITYTGHDFVSLPNAQIRTEASSEKSWARWAWDLLPSRTNITAWRVMPQVVSGLIPLPTIEELNTQDEADNGRTPLIKLAAGGKAQAIDRLFSRYPSQIDRTLFDFEGNRAIHVVRDVQSAQALKLGSLARIKASEAHEALQAAGSERKIICHQVLVEQMKEAKRSDAALLFSKNASGQTGFSVAVEKGDIELAKALSMEDVLVINDDWSLAALPAQLVRKANGETLLDIEDGCQRLPIQQAMMRLDVPMIQHLLWMAGEKIYEHLAHQDQDQENALHLLLKAISDQELDAYHAHEVLEAIIDNIDLTPAQWAALFSMPNHAGQTPFALFKSQPEIAATVKAAILENASEWKAFITSDAHKGLVKNLVDSDNDDMFWQLISDRKVIQDEFQSALLAMTLSSETEETVFDRIISVAEAKANQSPGVLSQVLLSLSSDLLTEDQLQRALSVLAKYPSLWDTDEQIDFIAESDFMSKLDNDCLSKMLFEKEVAHTAAYAGNRVFFSAMRYKLTAEGLKAADQHTNRSGHTARDAAYFQGNTELASYLNADKRYLPENPSYVPASEMGSEASSGRSTPVLLSPEASFELKPTK